MKQKSLLIAAVLIIISVALHGYLSFHYYDLHFSSSAAESACNINSVFNCDAVALSSYSSFMGIPLATFGMGFHVIMLLLTITLLMGFTSKPERAESLLINLAGLSVLASVVMAIISFTQMSVYCPNCIALYILSIATFLLLLFSQEDKNPIIHIKYFVQNIDKTSLIWIALLVVTPFLSHAIMMQKHGGNKTQKYAESGFNMWKTGTTHDLKPLHGISKGDSSSDIHIVEYADFLCPHCKKASATIKTFLNANPNIKFTFATFPLDGVCNPKIQRKGFGVTCRLSASILCAPDQDVAWSLHDHIFEHQEDYMSMSQTNNVDVKLKEVVEGKVNFEEFQACMDSEETYKKLAENATTADLAGLQGTPTFFVNGKKISNMLLIPVLNKIVDDLK